MGAYATVEEYRIDSGDDETSAERVQAKLDQQSAKLRAIVGISEKTKLSDDQRLLARLLVTDSAKKALVMPTSDVFEDASGISNQSFSANGFQGSVTYANPSGTAYFDNSTLKTFKSSFRGSQSIGVISPY